MEVGTEVEFMEEHCVLTCSSWLVLPRGGTIPSDLGLPKSIINHESGENGAQEIALWVRALAAKPDYLSSAPRPTRWKISL